MSFQPVVPLSGLGGWRFLERTEASQRAAFGGGPALARDIAYFKENISSATTAADLVANPRLLRVALGAFGLDDDANKQALVRRVLEEGSQDSASFANRLVDPRYKRLAEAFGYGDAGGARVGLPGFADNLSAAYQDRQFEIAVGESNPTLRLALNFRREISTFANARYPDGAAWFSVMGDPPVRSVLEAAFNLTPELGKLDIDLQRDIFRDKMSAEFSDSSLAVFKDPGAVDVILRKFIARRSAEEGPSASTPGSAALSLLQSTGGIGGISIENLLASNALRTLAPIT